jgi:hypothetical protein
MHQCAGIVLGLVIIFTLIVLYMSRSSGFQTTPVSVIPTQLPMVPATPSTRVMEPSHVIDHQYMSNAIPATDFDSFPESMSFTSLKVTSEFGTDEMPVQEANLVEFSGHVEDEDDDEDIEVDTM